MRIHTLVVACACSAGLVLASVAQAQTPPPPPPPPGAGGTQGAKAPMPPKPGEVKAAPPKLEGAKAPPPKLELKKVDSKDVIKAQPIDINSASEKELASLPGIGEARAKAIVAGRPYKGKNELLDRKIVPESTYKGIQESVVAKQK